MAGTVSNTGTRSASDEPQNESPIKRTNGNLPADLEDEPTGTSNTLPNNDTPVLPTASTSPSASQIGLKTGSSLKGSQASQAMVQSTSTSPSAQPPSSNELAGPSPYGTRSRNRTASSRPNYAEDRELEMDYDSGVSKGVASASSNGLQAMDVDKASGSSIRRTTANTTTTAINKGAAALTASKDLPGMSTFSVNSDVNHGAAPQSKKRKVAGSATTATQASSRKHNHSLSSAIGNTRESNMFSFEISQGYLKNGKLEADDGTPFHINDHVYLVCEPPGEPYYIARIMEFLHLDNDHNLPIESMRINWVYRPRDIGRKITDTRLLYVSMHSDPCPITSLRGKCRVLHRNDIQDLDEYRKVKDNFWFSQMYDRYMRRYYDVIPISQVTNVPETVKKVLDERWKFVIVEIGRSKELTSEIKTCKRCSGYCASNDSVDCAMCKNTYHMNCVSPPLPKKPARGFAWSCAPCSRKQEKKLEARNTPIVGDRALEGEEEEYLDEEEEGPNFNPTNGSSSGEVDLENGPRPATAEQLVQAKLWPYRYLGIHCRVEDALDHDDRIYPRASSRLGPRHQANVINWHGRPIELVKPAEIKRKYVKNSSHKKDAKLSKESIAALEADKVAREKRPKWVIDEPPGYVRRGEDLPNGDSANTGRLLFRLPEVGEGSSRGDDRSSSDKLGTDTSQREQVIEDYMAKAKGLAKNVGLKEYSTNFLDKALELLYTNNFQADIALHQLQRVNKRKGLKEPDLNKEELKRFEEGVAKFGTNLYEVSQHVGRSQTHGEIVRFYYMWKKTDRGKLIWGNFEGRKSKKQAKNLDSSLVDEVADDHDDSAFDNEKAVARKRGFECKFCYTRKSPQWRRAPGTAPNTTVPGDLGPRSGKDKNAHLMVALCQRCAGLWRKYAIQWENIDEVAKKVAQAGGRAWKRKMDEELLIELVNAEASSVGMSSQAKAAAASVGIDVPQSLPIVPEQEPRKKQKTGEPPPPVVAVPPPEPPKKKVIEKPPEPPLIPEKPKLSVLPCAVCLEMEPTGEEHFCCRHCRLTVHRNCYGIKEDRSASKWICDMCSNDATGQLSTFYDCALCHARWNEFELMEPPKASHKKKTDREREKERLEKELVVEATEQYRRKQIEMGRPECPREALKKTHGNNWVHVVCAVWTPGIKFGNAKALEPSEGLGSIPDMKFKQTCKLCKSVEGICVTCHKCPATFHVVCAQQYGYYLGFDVTPVKSSRRDTVNTISLGSEVGNVEAVIYCRDHAVKTIVHPMHEATETPGLNALQLFVRNFKQADLSLTGTVRKAAIINSSTKAQAQILQNGTGHRGSVSNISVNGTANSATVPLTRSSRASPAAVTVKSEEFDVDGDRVIHLSDDVSIEPVSKECLTCSAESSPKWHKIMKAETPASPPAAPIEPAPVPVISEISYSQQPSQINGHLEGHHVAVPEISTSHTPANHEGLANGLSVQEGMDAGQQSCDVVMIEQTDDQPQGLAPVPPEPLHSSQPSVVFQCHRCYLKKLNEPTPPLATPEPQITDPASTQRAETPETHVPSPVHPRDWPVVHNNWPIIPPSMPPGHIEGWASQLLPQANGSMRLPNGIPHSPPAHFRHHAPQSYANPPPQYHSNNHDQQRFGMPMQPQTNGGPAPYQRPTSGHPELVQYPGPPHHSSPSYARPPSNGIRSPPIHYRTTHHPPLGAPRAAENPFMIPHHSSPRPHYHSMHNSPQLRSHDERPETPTDVNGCNSGWTGPDGQVTNGASASPSLRNLLH